MHNLDHLAAALLEQRDEILARWRARVRELPSAAKLDVPTLNDHMPVWIAELASQLRVASLDAADEGDAVSVPIAHGLQRFEDGFDIEEVVSEYNMLRDCVHDVAEAQEIDLRGRARRLVNKSFDDAIGGAVNAFAESQAREVQRRRAEHLAFVAHDLRTPLGAITLSAHILEQRMPAESGSAETARLLRVLGRNARQLETLVGQILSENTQVLTELGVKVERRAFDLWPLVETLVHDMQPLAQRSGSRLLNQVPDDLVVHADAGLVRRIFQNLIGNAIGYTPGGEVAIGARDISPSAPVECWVTDNGAGIPRDRIDKVFEPLETDPQRDGIGLGLAIVKTFVEAHDGRVEVESEEGHGTTFRFTLPRTVRAADVLPTPVAA